MTETSRTRPSDDSEVPKFEEKPFEPASSGSSPVTNPPPLIDRPPFDGDDDKER